MTKSALRNRISASTDNNRKLRIHNESHNNQSKSKQKEDQVSGDLRLDEVSTLFPVFTPLLIFGVTLVFRVIYVLDHKNWWMLHPDEVYQSVEVAHIEVFGYGFRTYEFSPPETVSDEITGYRQMELKANMYALRSPIFPYYYVLVSWLAFLAGVRANPYVLWRFSHVIWSSLLPLAVYRYVLRLYGCKDTGCVAAILVASSTHLNVLGTHCLVHSFLAPLTFLALSMLTDSSNLDNRPSKHQSDIDMYLNYKLTSSTELSKLKAQVDLLNNASVPINRNATTKTNFKEKKQTAISSKTNGLNGVQQKKYSKVDKTDNYQHLLTVPQTNTRWRIQNVSSAFITTLTCYIRPDVQIIYIINLVTFSQFRQFLRPINMISFIAGVSGALAIGIGVDFHYYGWGVSSPINWVNFNIVLGLSSMLFGQMSCSFYIEKFFFHDLGITGLSMFAFCLCYLLNCRKQNEEINTQSKNANVSFHTNIKNRNVLALRSFIIWALPFVAYSFNGHKETRFIHDIITLFFIFAANVLVNLKYFFQSRIKYRSLLLLILVLFAVTQWESFPNHSNNLKWVYQKTEATHDVNSCIKYISGQRDVTGVFYDSNLFMTGGMSLLHHDVAIMSLVGGGFYEFGRESRNNYTRDMGPNDTAATQERHFLTLTKSINEFTKASNYFALSNAQASVRIIIQKPIYNYLVLRRDRTFLRFGFTEVFVTNHSRVLKRALDGQTEYMLQGLLDKISMGNNTTVLLHEGDVLFNMNQYEEASDRFYKAHMLDQTLLEAYLSLQACYNKLGNERAARAVHWKCMSRFDEVACSTP